jgi:VWFA-related protein
MRPLSLFVAVILLGTTVSAQRPGGGRPPVGVPTRSVPPGMGQKSPDMPGYYPGKRAEDEGNVEFRSETILVQVPVVATDKAGHHVHNLAKDDFQVFENGKIQKITAFEEVNATHTPLAVAQKPGFFTNVVLDPTQPRSVTVIALDTLNTPFLDQSFARKELVKYLANNLDTGQALALVLITSRGLKVVSGLTSSAEGLQQALKKAGGEISAMQSIDPDVEAAAVTGDTSDLFSVLTAADTQAAVNGFVTQGDVDYAQFKQDTAIETTMQAFLGIAWSLSGVPGRKTLVWATGGFPFSIDSPSSVPGGRLSLLYERAMQALNDSEVSVYPVDVQGLVNYAPEANTSRVLSGAAAGRQLSNRAWLLNAKQGTLSDFAEMTGGRAFYNTNDLAGAFQRAADDASSYYMIGYYLDTKNTKSGWRQLKVKMEKKDVEVRARKGFFVTNATMNPEATRINDMNFAIATPFEATGLPLVMQWGAVKDVPGKDKKQVAFTVHVVGSGILIEGRDNAFNLAVAAVATRPAGKKEGVSVVADNVSEDVKGNLKPESVANLRSHGLAYNNVLELAPGQYSVRFVVRDNLSGRMGSVSAPVTVN